MDTSTTTPSWTSIEADKGQASEEEELKAYIPNQKEREAFKGMFDTFTHPRTSEYESLVGKRTKAEQQFV